MFIKRLAPAFFSLIILASAAGCTARQAPAPTPQGYKTAPNNIVRNAQNNVIPPRQLAVLQSNAEGIIADADNKDWSKVQSRIAQIKTCHSQLKPLMQASSVPAGTVNNMNNVIIGLEKQASAKNMYETKVEANKLTSILPDVAGMYKMIVPADVGRLGYLAREISLNVEKGDWRAAKTNYDNARTMWDSLRTQLNTTYRADSANFATCLNNVGKAITDRSVVRVKADTKRLSDALAVLEADFTRQSMSR